MLIMIATISMITLVTTQQPSAFNILDVSIKQSTVKFNIITITSDVGDCSLIGQWNPYDKVCSITEKATIGINDTIVIQPNAVLEISNSSVVSNFGTIENNGIVDNHGRIFNYGIFGNYHVVNNDGLVKNHWGVIKNNQGSFIVNGGYLYDGKFGLRYIGTIENQYGTIQNNGTISNHSIINNTWDK